VSAAPPDAPRPDASGDAQAGTNQRLAQRRLISELARYFSYPTLARRHGWEGQVLLSLTIEADGHLQNLRLAHSSGHAVLDSAALQALHRVARLANAHEWLGGSAVDVRLPVIYRLQE
jgi:protein TonB